MRWATIGMIEVVIPQSLVRRWHRKVFRPMVSMDEFERLEVDARWPPACTHRAEPGMRVMVHMPEGYVEMYVETVMSHHMADIEVSLRADTPL